MIEIEKMIRSSSIIEKKYFVFVKYWITKKLFISTPYLPNEFFVKYFDLSQYFGRSLANNIKELFQITWLGYLIIVSSIVS